MPKDATKNVDRYKIRGGTLNEYEFEQGKTADKKQKAMDNWNQSAAAPQGMKSSSKGTQSASKVTTSASKGTKRASKGSKSASKATKKK